MFKACGNAYLAKQWREDWQNRAQKWKVGQQGVSSNFQLKISKKIIFIVTKILSFFFQDQWNDENEDLMQKKNEMKENWEAKKVSLTV